MSDPAFPVSAEEFQVGNMMGQFRPKLATKLGLTKEEYAAIKIAASLAPLDRLTVEEKAVLAVNLAQRIMKEMEK